ncbi:MAG: Tex-like N-terminal domain-containing protein, partial [Planctomycetota bacterium]
MAVDLDAIARSENCDVSLLRQAMTLIEQGYTPPFLIRYRRDELGSLAQRPIWTLYDAVRRQQQIDVRRAELKERLQKSVINDPSLLTAVDNAPTLRSLEYLSRRLRSEPSAKNSETAAHQLVARLLDFSRPPKKKSAAAVAPSSVRPVAGRPFSPQLSDSGLSPVDDGEPKRPADIDSVAAMIGDDFDFAGAKEHLSTVLPKRLVHHPVLIRSAVQWLAGNALLMITEVKDPHLMDDDNASEGEDNDAAAPESSVQAEATESETAVTFKPTEERAGSDTSTEAPAAVTDVATSAETPSAETPGAGAEASATPDAATQPVAIESSGDTPAGAAGSDAETAAAPATPVASPAPTSDATPKTNPAETVSTEANAAEVSDAPADAGQVDPAATPADGEAVADGDAQDTAQDKAAKGKGGDLKGGGQKPKEKSRKRFSPRQKRRKWLVGVLQPLAGKRH